MIIGLSTSSPWTSVAVLDGKRVLWSRQKFAPRGAGSAALELIEEMKAEYRLEDAELFAADIGPGSFVGVRVGVTLAKTMAYAFSRPVAGATSFDLISASEVVALPSRKGEFFVRVPGETPYRTETLPANTIGYGFEPETPPNANRFIVGNLIPCEAASFAPDYMAEPSISTPKKAYRTVPGG